MEVRKLGISTSFGKIQNIEVYRRHACEVSEVLAEEADIKLDEVKFLGLRQFAVVPGDFGFESCRRLDFRLYS